MRIPSARSTTVVLCLSALLLLALPAVAGARPSGHVGVGTPAPTAGAACAFKQGPLNPAFIRYQKELAEGKVPRGYGDHGLGLTPAPLDLPALHGAQPKVSPRSYPATYDLRTLGRVSSVKDQGPNGTCWAFATMGSLESCLLPAESFDFSEDNMVLTSGFDYPYGHYETGGATGSRPPIWRAGAGLSSRARTPTATTTVPPASHRPSTYRTSTSCPVAATPSTTMRSRRP